MKLESGVEKLPLYRKGSCHLKAGESVDLGTYFNAFSLAKWLRYTTLDAVSLELRFQGTAHVTLYGGNAAGMQDIASAVATDGWSWQVSDEELATIGREAVLLGVRLEAHPRRRPSSRLSGKMRPRMGESSFDSSSMAPFFSKSFERVLVTSEALSEAGKTLPPRSVFISSPAFSISSPIFGITSNRLS